MRAMKYIACSLLALVFALFSIHCASPGGGSPTTTAESGRGATASSAPKLSAEFLSGLERRMVSIPGGSYSTTYPGLKERHRVRAFRLGRNEVTQREWATVMGRNPSHVVGDDLPVTNVSFLDVKIFLERLNASAGASPYRLPTRVEWEYACHAHRPGKFSWGNDFRAIGKYAWWGKNSGEQPHPVGEKPPNAWGLHDMIGNASEWTSDQMDSGLRFIEGGDFYEENDSGLFCENRSGLADDSSGDATGFRLARDARVP